MATAAAQSDPRAEPTPGERLEASALDAITRLRAVSNHNRYEAHRIAEAIERALTRQYAGNIIHGQHPELSPVSYLLRDYGPFIRTYAPPCDDLPRARRVTSGMGVVS